MMATSQTRSVQHLLGSCMALLTACHAGPSQTASAGTAAPATVGRDAAAIQIASARCDHEVACGAVGAGRSYAARDECATELLRSAQADLAANPCAVGIEARLLQDCTSRLRAESCHPLSTLTRMYACRPTGLCMHTSTEFSSFDVYGE
jgi:hypothetical protein